MTDRRETLPIPAQWSYLADECGAIDRFLLTPLGRERGRELAPAAVRGGYYGDGNTADGVLAVWRGDHLALVAVGHVKQVFGQQLSVHDLAAIGKFIAQHRGALLDH